MDHPKIRQLKLRADIVNFSTMSVDQRGELIEEGNLVRCYVCVWGQRDTYGTVWVRGCFSKSIEERGPNSNSKQKIAVVWQHDLRDPIGQITELREDDYGLYCEFVFDDPEAVPSAKRAKTQIKSGTINQYSFRFDWIWDKLEYEKEVLELREETDIFVRSIPRKQQHELKQLISRHIALAKAEPERQAQPPLDKPPGEPPKDENELSLSLIAKHI